MSLACRLAASSLAFVFFGSSLFAAESFKPSQMDSKLVFKKTDKSKNEEGIAQGVIPITKNSVLLSVPQGAFSVISFPFTIVDLKKASNGGAFSSVSDDIDMSSFNSKEGVQQPQAQSVSNEQIATIERGVNTVTLFGKEFGELKFIAWREDGYPVQFDVKVVEPNKGLRYYEFIDSYGSEKKKSAEFEANEHESVVSELIRSAYIKKPPKGYKVFGTAKSVKTAGLLITNILTYAGDAYAVQEWNIRNETKNEIELYEEMFYEQGIYAAAFVNSTLQPGEACRMFIVRSADGI